MRPYLNRFTLPSGLGVAALILLGLFYGGSASADGESTDPAAGTVVVENEPVLYDLCRTDDGGTTYTFVSGVPETELRDSDVYNGEDGISVTGQADCDALEPVVQEEPPPPADTDGDGIPDDSDSCPNEAPTTDTDGDGCEDPPVENNDPPQNEPTPTPTPAADSDGDGVNDDVDACPDVAPSFDENGDGCEDEAAAAGDVGTTAVCPPTAGFGVTPGACGTIRICKEFLFDLVDPATDPQADFTGDNGFTATFSLGDGECEPAVGGISLTSGTTYAITETAVDDPFKIGQPTGGIVCTGGANVTEDEDAGSVQIALNAGENVVCTFNNVEESAGLQICKAFVGDNVTGLQAEFSSGIPQFNTSLPNNLGDDCAPPRPVQGSSFFGVLPGDYNVTEDLGALPAGFQLTDIDCEAFGGPFTNFTENLQTGALDITLQDFDSVTCTFTNTQFGGGCTAPAIAGFGPPPPGCVEVCKVTVPPGVNQDFAFIGTGDVGNFTLNPSTTQCVVDEDVTPGFSHDITETIPDGWELTDIACQSTGGTSTTFEYGNGTFDSGFDFGDDTARVNLALGEDVQCVFTNTQGDAQLSICKATDPEAEDFDFNFTGDLGAFTLNAGDPTTECVDRDLPAGQYVVTETIPTGWELTNIINGCNSNTGGSTFEYGSGGVFDSTFDEGDDSVEITLAEGDLVSCVFVNTDVTGRISICKQTNPENIDQDFSFSGDLGLFTLNDAVTAEECVDESDLLPDQPYVITENVPVGWQLTNIINGCDHEGDSTIEYGSGGTFDGTFTPGEDDSVRITLAEGDFVSCIFINEQVVGGGCTAAFAPFGTTPGCIEVCKVTNPPGVNQDFEFGFAGGGVTGPFTLNASGGATQCHLDLQLNTVDTYSYTETVPFGWQLTGIDCQSEGNSAFQFTGASGGTNDFEPGDNTVSVNLAEDDDVQCIFTNTQVGGGCAVVTGFGCIEICKVTSPPNADQDVAFTSDFGAFTLNALSDTCEVTDIGPGDWDVTEEIPGGWLLTNIACESLGGTVSDSSFQFLGSGTTDTNFDPGDDLVRISLTVGDGVQCIFTNTERIGGACGVFASPVAGFGSNVPMCVEICKVTDPSGANQDFTFAGPSGSFQLNAAGTQCQTFQQLSSPSQRLFTETVPAGWQLTNINCGTSGIAQVAFGVAGDTGSFGPTFEAGDNTARVSSTGGAVAAAQCIFTNTQLPGGDCLAEPTVAGFGTGTACIEICKATNPAAADVEFNFDATDDLGLGFSLNASDPDGDCIAFEELPAGDYEVTELAPSPPWVLTNIECEVVAGTGDSTFARDGSAITISLADGEGVQCTFTNTQVGGGCTAPAVAGFGPPAPGCVEVCKVTNPAGADQDFDFGDGIILNASAPETQCEVLENRTGAELTETVPNGWALTNIDCQSTGSGGSTFVYVGATESPTNDFELGDDTVQITVGSDDDVLCIFTNTDEIGGDCIPGDDPESGCVEICKVTDPPGVDQNFSFQGGNFTLNPSAEETECESFPGLLPANGPYDFGETVPDGWELIGIDCQSNGVLSAFEYGVAGDDPSFDSSFVAGDDTARIFLGPSEFVQCIFTNTEEQVGGECTPGPIAGFGGPTVPQCGFIRVCKTWQTEDATGLEASFETNYIAANGPDFILVGQQDCFPAPDEATALPPGQYTIEELVELLPPGFVLDSRGCDILEGAGEGSDSTFGQIENGVRVDLASGDLVRCVFSNREIGGGCTPPTAAIAGFGNGPENGCIEVCKVTDPPHADQDFNFDLTGPNIDDFFIINPGDNAGEEDCRVILPNAVPGEYEITENVPPGWLFDRVECANEGASETTPIANGILIDLAAGDDVSCIFFDVQLPPNSITVCKVVEGPDTGQEFEFTTAPDDFDIDDLANGECDTDDDLEGNNYFIDEVVPEGWQVNDIECVSPGDSEFEYGIGNEFDPTFTFGDDAAHVLLADDDAVTCTFFDQQEPGRIIICKSIVEGSDQSQVFDIETSNFGPIEDLGHGQCEDFILLLPDDFSFTELVPDGWDLLDIECVDNESDSTFEIDPDGDPHLVIHLVANGDVTCTFINEESEVGGGGDDDDDADDDDDGRQPGQRQPRPQQPGAGGKPGVGTGDGSFDASADGGRNVMLPVLAFLGATGLLTLGFTHWQRRR